MIKLITDSTSELTSEEAKKYNIDVIPLYVVANDRTFKDKIDIFTDDIFEFGEDVYVKTSQPSPHDFLEVFDKYENDEVIFISCSSKISGTYQSALLAKEQAKNKNIEVIDSLTTSLGLKNLVYKTVDMIENNYIKDDIVNKINYLKKRLVTGGMAENLEYIKKSGRVSNLKLLAGKLLKIRPIIIIKNGELISYKKKSRSVSGAIKVVSEMVNDFKIDESLGILLGYTKSKNNADILKNQLLNMGIEDTGEKFEEIGPVIGAHIGPNCVMISFFSQDIIHD